MERSGLGFVLTFVVLGVAVGFVATRFEIGPSDVAVIGFIAFTIIILAFAAATLWMILNGEISLAGIVSEPKETVGSDDRPKASLSRFQFLLFSFVVAGLVLLLSIESGGFVDIPPDVLGLIGISGGSFVVSKAVGHKSEPKKPDQHEPSNQSKNASENKPTRQGSDDG